MAYPQDGSNVGSSAPGGFHQNFRRGIATLQEQADSLLAPEASLSDRQATIDATMVGIAKLSTELADACGELPSYDQRSYNQAIKGLQDKLALARASHAPRTKFSFKNKRLAAPTSEANSVNTSRSVTPTHLRDPDNVSRGVPTPAFAAPSAHVLSVSDPDHHDEFQRRTTDDNQWILLSSQKNAYVRWPPRVVEDGNSSSPHHGKTCIVSEISNSVISIERDSRIAPPSALTLTSTDGSLILAPDIRGAAHITGLCNSTLVLSCHQFRMHKSHDVKVYLYCPNRPIIEDCSGIEFTSMPSALDPSSLGADDDREDRISKQNMFDQVDDFKWLRSEASPNWRLMREDEAITEQSWQGILQRLRKADGEAHGETDLASVAQILSSLDIQTVQ